jgi:hypothetical protein
VSLDIILSNTGRLLPSLEPLSATYASSGEPSGFLSIAVVNVRQLLGEDGGTGYLDGITTVGQTVGCIVEYIHPTTGQIMGWVLETSTQATIAGQYRRPLDYNASTNTKVWRSLY